MPVFKNESNNTWYVMARYVNWKGERKQKCKRGFTTQARSAGVGADVSVADRCRP